MKILQTGQFFGQTNKTFNLEGFTMTDTEYTVDLVDWHYHENPYFTFLIFGNLIEGNKKETYNCSAGTLLFHNWQEPHFNVKPEGYTQGFHLEISQDWCRNFEVDLNRLPGNLNVKNPQVRILFHNIYKETKLFDKTSTLAVESLLLSIFEELGESQNVSESKTPRWVKEVDEILHESFAEHLTLKDLSSRLNIHPIYLSRSFPKFFRTTFGEYIRKIRVEKSLRLLRQKNIALTEISAECGFADQSHFIRCFREFVGISPKEYRKRILR